MTIIELRIYTTLPGRMPNLLARFENHTTKIWERYGIKQIGFFTTVVGPNSNDLTYMLQWDSLADREQKWSAFMADKEWIGVRAESEKDGPINQNVYSSFLAPTAFSALK
ncbi:NIPSNAP-domain-containing protein [Rhizodiscina lignyota]|uniref:NIPSNAP-domain-containing protein n=1 Tax=Rhizodiscina lignyota TaxID=1504668 RepID=A0A9P4I670_9PEZI|nr:NIPSNAP-domain-containing protein [Rhizodiscina lignyota]